MRLRFFLLLLALGFLAMIVAVSAQPSPSPVAARLRGHYAEVLFSDGSRNILPLDGLSPEQRARLARLAAEHPLPKSHSSVLVVSSTAPLKHTIVTRTKAGPVETVQLCPPNVLRDQTASFCALYARVHWLDIAGYYVTTGDITRIEGIPANQDDPWSNPRYRPALDQLVVRYVPPSSIHFPPPAVNTFEWIRSQIRLGRPVLAAFTHDIWLALPPEFIAAHGWDGGKVGHAIVVNGFTWNRQTKKGTFHIVNSWRQLFQFDLPVTEAQEVLAYPESLSPRGTIETPEAPERVTRITFIKALGNTNLYQTETTRGSQRVIAPSETAARNIVENSSKP